MSCVMWWYMCSRRGSTSWNMINLLLGEILMHVCIDRTLPPVILKITTHYSLHIPSLPSSFTALSPIYCPSVVTAISQPEGTWLTYSDVKDKVGQDYSEISDAAHWALECTHVTSVRAEPRDQTEKFWAAASPVPWTHVLSHSSLLASPPANPHKCTPPASLWDIFWEKLPKYCVMFAWLEEEEGGTWYWSHHSSRHPTARQYQILNTPHWTLNSNRPHLSRHFHP